MKIFILIKYGAYGATESCVDLQNDISLIVDGKEVPLPKLEGLLVVNIPSWAGGTDLWNFRRSDEKKGWKKNEFDDGMLEVVALKSAVHAARIKGHMSNSVKIAQGSKVWLEMFAEGYCQIDGEPWIQSPCKIKIELFNRVPMLKRVP